MTACHEESFVAARRHDKLKEEDDLVSDEELEKAIEIQSRRVQGGTVPLIGNLLIEMDKVDQPNLDVELEKQARERIRVCGKESAGH